MRPGNGALLPLTAAAPCLHLGTDIVVHGTFVAEAQTLLSATQPCLLIPSRTPPAIREQLPLASSTTTKMHGNACGSVYAACLLCTGFGIKCWGCTRIHAKDECHRDIADLFNDELTGCHRNPLPCCLAAASAGNADVAGALHIPTCGTDTGFCWNICTCGQAKASSLARP
jgi:hypothetical protein